MKKMVFLLLALILTISCGSLPSLFATPTPTPTTTQTPSPTQTPTQTYTPTPTIVPPEPPVEGYSNVYGRVLFRGQPVQNFSMSLNNVLSGEEYLEYYWEYVETDSDGRFVFTDIPSGDGYILDAGIYDSSELAGIAGAVPVTLLVQENTNLNYGEYYLVETNLTLLSPDRNSTLTDTPSSLSWAAYPGAAYYHVELKQAYGTYTDLELDTSETHVDLEQPLMDCIYGWDVTAYTAAGIPLARSDSAYVDDESMFFQKYDGYFTIKNDLLPWCQLQLISPASNEEITSGKIEFIWEMHPLAVRYHVRIERHSGNIMQGTYVADYDFFSGDFIVQEDGSLLGPSLPYFGSGSYPWHVSAYTEDGGFIAYAESRFWIP